jgi:hypothetical protein
MIKLISEAKYLGPDVCTGRDQGGTPAIIQVRLIDGDVRFFSVSAKDHQDAERINAAARELTAFNHGETQP